VEISVVTTIHKNEDIFDIFITKFYEEFKKSGVTKFEIIFVIDEKQDNSFKRLVELKDKFKNISIINLTKNFGHHEAILTGIEHATGKFTFVIDSDLEEDPAIFSDFYKEIKKENVDLVIGYQKKRKGGLFEKISGNLAYFYLNKVLKIEYPKNPTNASIMTKQFRESLLKHPEKSINYIGLLTITGFNHVFIQIQKHSKSKSTYTLRKKVDHLLNISLTYSTKSLTFLFYVALTNFVFSLVFVMHLVYKYYTTEILDGYTSILISVWFFSSIIILFLGVLSFYLKIIMKEVKSRPRTIIKNIK
jgi:putative glycosyltransferase